MENVTLIQLPVTEAHKIQHLWEQLNELHRHHSPHFKSFFSSYSFTGRMKEFAGKQATIFAAMQDDTISGYCLCSIEANRGEIDSLFVAAEVRHTGLGGKLVQNAISWLQENGSSTISVAIAHGNEQVLPFYEHLGFRLNSTVLRLG